MSTGCGRQLRAKRFHNLTSSLKNSPFLLGNLDSFGIIFLLYTSRNIIDTIQSWPVILTLLNKIARFERSVYSRSHVLLNLMLYVIKIFTTSKEQDKSANNDPLGLTHSPASSDHYSHLRVVLFCEILKSGDRRTDRHNVWK